MLFEQRVRNTPEEQLVYPATVQPVGSDSKCVLILQLVTLLRSCRLQRFISQLWLLFVSLLFRSLRFL